MKIICKVFLCLCLILVCSFTAFADGDPNIDGGGGSTGDGDVAGGSFWSVGDDGVRISIVEEKNKKVKKTLDFTNASPPNSLFHFGRKSKLSYSTGTGLIPDVANEYKKVKPDTPLPSVVTASGGANIDALKRYFSDKSTLEFIAAQTGFDYDRMISGDYVLLLEPIIYCSFNGIKYAMTATEAALFDQVKDGGLKAKLGYATHQNLPLAMFLETPDLGYPAWSGPRTGVRTNSEIISALGLGTVRFREGAPPPEELGEAVLKYRTDIDVITAVTVRNNSASGIDPDKGAEVVFTIGGTRYRKRFVTPPNEDTLVWVRWHTPATPQRIGIQVSSTHGSVSASSLSCNVVGLVEATPPDPQGRDEPPQGYKVPKAPEPEGVKEADWGEWNPYYVENWVWDEDWEEEEDGSMTDNGEWVDEGWWEYDWQAHSASLSVATTVKPAAEVPTAKKSPVTGVWDMKSGYGVSIEVKTQVYNTASTADVTHAQNTVAQFPEFFYQDYFRILERTPTGGLTDRFKLRYNKYSFMGASSHYTPIWYPDKSKYEPKVTVFDVWTPAGQLYYTATDHITINGDCYDDWNIAPVKE